MRSIMKINWDRKFIDNYYSGELKLITVLLHDGVQVKGVINGFSITDSTEEYTQINSIHIVPPSNGHSLGIDSFGFLIGEIIMTKDIDGVLMIKLKFR